MSWRFRESKSHKEHGLWSQTITSSGRRNLGLLINKMGAHLAQGLASRRGSVNSSCCLVSKGALERESRLGLIQTPICSQCLTKEAWPDGLSSQTPSRGKFHGSEWVKLEKEGRWVEPGNVHPTCPPGAGLCSAPNVWRPNVTLETTSG